MRNLNLTCALIIGSLCALAQPIQYSKWCASATEIDVSAATLTSNPTMFTAPSGFQPGTAGNGYNSWYENGELLFYVAATSNGGIVYDKNNTALGTLYGSVVIQGQIGIIPHHDNYTNMCSRKFWIICNAKYPGWTTGVVSVALLDLNNTMNTVQISTSLGTSGANPVTFAISKMDATSPAHERYIYLHMAAQDLTTYKLDASGFTLLSTDHNTVDGGMEMELSNNGDRLACGDPSYGFQIFTLVSHQFNSVQSMPATALAGLEFDDTGNLLYYASQGGIRTYNISTNAVTLLSGSSSYATGMLEKTYSNGTVPTRIICGNATSLASIDLSNNTTATLTSNVAGLIMPNQIDGEDVDEKMFYPTIPVTQKNCPTGNFYVTLHIHPYITQFYTSLFQIMEGPYGSPTNIIPYTQTVLTYPAANGSYEVGLHNISNTSCKMSKGYSLYVFGCPTGKFYAGVSIDNTPSFYLRLTGQPANPDDERTASGFMSSWSVHELDPITRMPIYTISDDVCWMTPPGEDIAFPGFDAVDYNYAGGDAFDCGASPFGEFLYGHTYWINRTVSADGVDPLDYGAIVTVSGPGADNTGKTSIATGIATPAKNPGLENKIAVSPNPGSGIFNIKAAVNTGYIEVIGVLGTKLKTIDLKNNFSEYALDLSGFSKGIYLLNIYSDGAKATKKIILE